MSMFNLWIRFFGGRGMLQMIDGDKSTNLVEMSAFDNDALKNYIIWTKKNLWIRLSCQMEKFYNIPHARSCTFMCLRYGF